MKHFLTFIIHTYVKTPKLKFVNHKVVRSSNCKRVKMCEIKVCLCTAKENTDLKNSLDLH